MGDPSPGERVLIDIYIYIYVCMYVCMYVCISGQTHECSCSPVPSTCPSLDWLHFFTGIQMSHVVRAGPWYVQKREGKFPKKINSGLCSFVSFHVVTARPGKLRQEGTLTSISSPEPSAPIPSALEPRNLTSISVPEPSAPLPFAPKPSGM